jgi:hypothetical protein
MGQSYTHFESDDRKAIEYDIFDKSFQLIEKYVKNANGLRENFNKEYSLAINNNKNGYLNWHKVMPKQLKGVKGMAYIEAIKTVANLLKKAENNHRTSGSNSDDRLRFREVYELIDRLIDIRENELNPELSCLCLAIIKGDKYKSHEPVVNAWKEFRQ